MAAATDATARRYNQKEVAMDLTVPGRFLKLYEMRQAAAIPRVQWQVVVANGATGGVLRQGYELLGSFEGCWVRADAILCRLDECREPPHQWSRIRWEENGGGAAVMCFPLGKWVSILLPADSPPE